MEQLLLVVQVIIAAALIGIVLLQRSDTDGFGLGSGSGSNFMSGRATANLLTRTTAILAGLFIINSLALSIMAAHHSPVSIVDTIEAGEAKDVTPTPKKGENKPSMAVEKAPAAPAVPNADEKPVKAVKKAKPVVDAEEDTDTNSAN